MRLALRPPGMEPEIILIVVILVVKDYFSEIILPLILIEGKVLKIWNRLM